MNMYFFSAKQQSFIATNRMSLNNNIPMISPHQGQARTQKQNLVHQTSPEPPNPSGKKEMLWGAPTWFLLHTIAEKVKDESFMAIRSKLFEIIYTICTNLPCPKCSAHATEYMKSINFNSITSKRDLQLMLFKFHNEVNGRKGLPIFDLSELNAKYSAANTVNIIHNFFFFFRDNSKNVNMISLNMYRERIIKDLQTWFQFNISNFDL
jgi:hypothetical protein